MQKFKQNDKRKKQKNMFVALEQQQQQRNEWCNENYSSSWTLEDSNVLLKGVAKTIKNETKEQKGRFLEFY